MDWRKVSTTALLHLFVIHVFAVGAAGRTPLAVGLPHVVYPDVAMIAVLTPPVRLRLALLSAHGLVAQQPVHIAEDEAAHFGDHPKEHNADDDDLEQ